MKILRFLPVCALAGAVFGSVAMAQSAAPSVRIVNRIDANHLVPLKGDINPNATAENDRGPVSPQLAMSGMTLVLSRSAEQQAAFDAYVEGEYDPGSPDFHQWLTPEQVGERFGPASADIATITNWLTSQGFYVTRVAPDRMTINFSGSAATVQSAFHTAIHNLSVNGVAHIANMTDPQIPAALAPVVMGIKGLHNFRPHPLHKTGNHVQLNPQTHAWERLTPSPAASLAAGGAPAAAPAEISPAAAIRPEFTYSGGTGSSSYVVEDVSPYDFATMYNVLPLWQKTTPIDGSGQTIAIIGTSDINPTDISTFKSVFGLPAGKAPVMAHPTGGNDPGVCTSTTNACGIGDLEENSLDVEWSGAVAPGAQIVLVTEAYDNQTSPTNDPIFDSSQWVVDNVGKTGNAVSGARVMSISYGSCELSMGTASNVAYHDLWQTAYAEGLAVFVASGDSGAPACDQGGDGVEGVPYSAQYGLSVNGLASTPYNTAVGGTDLAWCKPKYDSNGNFTGCASTNASPYWNTTNNSTNQSTAKNYVPEAPWNDSCLNPTWAAFIQSVAPLFNLPAPSNAEAACNFIYKNWAAMNQSNLSSSGQQFVLAGLVDTVGAGGGASNCVSNDGSNASTCESSSSTTTGSGYGNEPLVNDGWPKPSWQSGVSGIPNDQVRDLPDVSFFAGDGALNSATLVCVSAAGGSCTTLSATGSSSNGGALEIGGTSVATPEMAGVMALINQGAGSAQGNPNAQLYQLAAKQNATTCKSEGGTTSNGCSFNDVDQGTVAMPCAVSTSTKEGGAVYDSTTGQYNTNASTTQALASPNCTATNSGDAIGTLGGFAAAGGYDQATGLGSLNVANVVSNWTAFVVGSTTANVTVTPASGTLTSTNTLNVTVTVAGSSGTPTGGVTLTASGTTYIAGGTLSAGTYTFTIPVNTFTASGTATLTANYAGDATYAAASGTATIVVSYVPPPTYTMASIANPAAISAGGTATANVTVSSSTGYNGTVTLSCSLTSQPTNANSADLPSCSGNQTVALNGTTTSGSKSFTVTTTKATAALELPVLGNGKGWMGAGGGAVLAFLVFLGVPARRRSWRAMLGMLAFALALGTFTACGGGGGGGTTGGGGTPNPGTTAGSYVFTVTASGNPTQKPVPAQTFTVTVQ